MGELMCLTENECVAGNLAGALEAAVHGVVLELVLHVLRGHGRVDVLDRERVALHGDADNLAANAAEAVDAKLDLAGHHGRGSVAGGERGEGSEHDCWFG